MFLEEFDKPHFLKVEVGRSARQSTTVLTHRQNFLPTLWDVLLAKWQAAIKLQTVRHHHWQLTVLGPKRHSPRAVLTASQRRWSPSLNRAPRQCWRHRRRLLRRRHRILFFNAPLPWRRTYRTTSARGRAFKSTPQNSYISILVPSAASSGFTCICLMTYVQ